MPTPEETRMLKNVREGTIFKLGGKRFVKLAGNEVQAVEEEIPRSSKSQQRPIDTKQYSGGHQERSSQKSYETRAQDASHLQGAEQPPNPRRRPSAPDQHHHESGGSTIGSVTSSRLQDATSSSVRRGDVPSSTTWDVPVRQRNTDNQEEHDLDAFSVSPRRHANQTIPSALPGPGPRTSGRNLPIENPREQSHNVLEDHGGDFTVLEGAQKTFASFRLNDFVGRAKFLAKHPDLLKSKYDKILEEAVLRIKDDQIIAAQQCLQSLAILGHCQKIRSRYLEDEVLDMQKAETDQKTQYDDRFRDLFRSAQQLAKDDQGKRRKESERVHRHAGQNVAGSSGQPGSTPGHAPSASKTDSSSFAAGNDILEGISNRGDVHPIQTKEWRQIDPKDFSKTEMRKLSAKYKMTNGRKFFVPGKVFAMIFHESAGEDSRFEAAANIDKIDPNITIGPYGERIYSHIRRMVVIRSRDGYCWCLGINSYGGYGLKKKNLKRTEIEAHTIIHDSTKKPVALEKEPEIFKDSIAVKTVNGQNLTEASRLHYGKPYVVEWNQRVMEVGDVESRCLPTLLTDARMELLGDTPRGSSHR